MRQLTINITDLVNYQYGYRELLKQVEPVYICELLRHTKGNKSRAARIAGISRGNFIKKMRHYNITVVLQISGEVME
jgi:DNA-binding protein Fis